MSSPNPSDIEITECEKKNLNYNWSMRACLLTQRYNTSMKKHNDKEGRQELDGDDNNGEQLSGEEDFLNSQQPHVWILPKKKTEWIKFNLIMKSMSS